MFRSTLSIASVLSVLSMPVTSFAIIGGSPVAESDPEFQYTVGVVTDAGDICSGVLIADSFVLTAGHCIRNENPAFLPEAENLQVVFEKTLPRGSFTSNVKRFILHPDFDPDLDPITATDWFYAHDLALIELSEPAPPTKRPISISGDSDLTAVAQGTLAQFAGFGLTENPFEYFLLGRGTVGVLHTAQLEVTVFENSPIAGPKLIVQQSTMPGANFGDSGGPLTREVLVDGVLRTELIGIDSEAFDPQVPPGSNLLAFEAVGPGSYSAFTPVATYADWILEVIGVHGPVDDADLAAWRANFGLPNGAAKDQGDANNDGDVDGGDFLIWQQQFSGPAVRDAAKAIPEPKTALLIVSGLLAVPRQRSVVVP
jgi:secreted trypsin-like serine protease